MVRRRGIFLLWLSMAALAALSTVAPAGCGDPFEAFLAPVPEETTEVSLVDFRAGPLTEPSAFDLLNSIRARVDQTPAWDFVFFITEGGAAQLRPFAAVADQASEAGLQRVEEAFDAVREAPAEGYETDEPVPIAEGDVLAARSRVAGGCRRFGKLEVLEIDLEAGTLTFRHLRNPNCGFRGLVPGETGSPT